MKLSVESLDVTTDSDVVCFAPSEIPEWLMPALAGGFILAVVGFLSIGLFLTNSMRGGDGD